MRAAAAVTEAYRLLRAAAYAETQRTANTRRVAPQLAVLRPKVLYMAPAGTGVVMSSETIVAVSGLIGLGAAALTGALWDSPLVPAFFRLRENLRSQGRHAMPR